MEDLGYWANSEATVLPVEYPVEYLEEFPVACPVESSAESLAVPPEESPEVLPEEFLAEPLVVLDLGYRRKESRLLEYHSLEYYWQDRHKREEDSGCCFVSCCWVGVPVRTLRS